MRLATRIFMWAAALTLTACTQPPPPTDNFALAGYFRDKPGNRVFTIELAGSATPEEVRQHAATRAHTLGQVTSVYFYPSHPRIPRDGVSLAENFVGAIAVVHELPGAPQWRYAFQRNFTGEAVFHDCQAEPSEPLCARDAI